VASSRDAGERASDRRDLQYLHFVGAAWTPRARVAGEALLLRLPQLFIGC